MNDVAEKAPEEIVDLNELRKQASQNTRAGRVVADQIRELTEDIADLRMQEKEEDAQYLEESLRKEQEKLNVRRVRGSQLLRRRRKLQKDRDEADLKGKREAFIGVCIDLNVKEILQKKRELEEQSLVLMNQLETAVSKSRSAGQLELNVGLRAFHRSLAASLSALKRTPKIITEDDLEMDS